MKTIVAAVIGLLLTATACLARDTIADRVCRSSEVDNFLVYRLANHVYYDDVGQVEVGYNVLKELEFEKCRVFLRTKGHVHVSLPVLDPYDRYMRFLTLKGNAIPKQCVVGNRCLHEFAAEYRQRLHEAYKDYVAMVARNVAADAFVEKLNKR